MPSMISGIHHYTYCGGPAQEDLNFHTRLLGLRLLKQTGLYEGKVPIYHLYYGNAEGDAGTVLTSFPMRQQGIKGRLGTDQISRLNLSIPREAIGFWMDRLRAVGARRHDSGAVRDRAHPLRPPLRRSVRAGRGRLRRPESRLGGGRGPSRITRSWATTESLSTSSDPDAMIGYLETGLGVVADGTDASGRRWRLGSEPHRVGFVELVEDRRAKPARASSARAPSITAPGTSPTPKCRRRSGSISRRSATTRSGWAPATAPTSSRFTTAPRAAPCSSTHGQSPSCGPSMSRPTSSARHTKIPPTFLDQADTILDYLEPLDVRVAVTGAVAE